MPRALAAVLLVAAPAFADTIPPMPPIAVVKSITATSTYRDKKNSDAYAPWRVLSYELRDWNEGEPVPLHAWCEGKPDAGIGESITVTFAGPTAIDEISVAGGVWLTDKLFAANNQITVLEVIADGKAPVILHPSSKEWETGTLGGKVTTLVLRVASVKRGKMNDSCISAVDLRRGDTRIVPLTGIEPAALDALPGALRALQAALQTRGPGLEALLSFPFSSSDADGFFMGAGDNGATFKDFKSLIAACKAYEKRREKVTDDYVDPRGCPSAVDVDESDERPALLEANGPGGIEVLFPSHREVSVTWSLVYEKGRWRLSSIGYR